MPDLYTHQREGITFLAKRSAAMLCDEMGTGKSRQVLVAAKQLFDAKKIDRVLVLLPAAVKFSWNEELIKIAGDFIGIHYEPSNQKLHLGDQYSENDDVTLLPICCVSYALLPQKRHVEALKKWCEDGKTLLVCDESSFLKNRTAKQTKGSASIARRCFYVWLLSGTPIANSPLDLFGQALVMSNGAGPLKGFKSFYHFRARYAVLKMMNMGQVRFQQVVGYQNLDELTKRFAPYVLRREKKDCLDLPEKTYTVREVALNEATWRIYTELRREAMLCLPDTEECPEPNAAVRILRLCQLTSGHMGNVPITSDDGEYEPLRDVSSEKLDYLVDSILNGELSNECALICWCRWRRERERLRDMLTKERSVLLWQVFGGQSQKDRDDNIKMFQSNDCSLKNILLAQPHAGGFGLNLTAASTAVYLSNDFSHTTRVQSEDRIHRIGQNKPCLYVDVVAVGPKNQHTVDSHVLDCLRAKKDLAAMTCGAWRRVLEE